MDDGAFGRLLSGQRDFLVNYTRKKFRCSKDDAEDTAQSALLKAWENRDRYEERHQLRAWLVAITWNHHVSVRRRAWRLVFTDDEMALSLTTPANQEDAFFLKQVFAAMRELPPDMMAAVAHISMGEQYEEAGEILRTAVGTIKSQVSRGRSRLKKAVL